MKDPQSTAEALKPEDGFVFEQCGEKEAILRRRSDGLGVATVSCGCSGSGSCKIVIDVGTGAATCEGECSGGCAWVIGAIGLLNKMVLA